MINQSDPIIIYQMGKVGSTSVKSSLENLNLSNPVYQIHFLSWKTVKEVEKFYLHKPHVKFPGHIIQSKTLRKLIDQNDKSLRWKIITLVRDPVARKISDIFENIDRDLPYLSGKEEAEAETLIEGHIKRLFQKFDESTDYANCWFDREIKDVFNFDIYSIPFNKNEGYQIYETDTADILLIRLENLSEMFSIALSNFMNIDNASLIKGNIAENKSYRTLYRRILNNISIPIEILDKVYASRYARHFYTHNEIDNFKIYWSKEGNTNLNYKNENSKTRSKKTRKILIIHPEGNINHNPNLTGIVEILAENNYCIHIISPKRTEIYQHFESENVKLCLFNIGNVSDTEGFVILADKKFGSSVELINYIKNDLEHYDFVIGIDRGIIEASIIAKIKQIPYGLISYEVFFKDETSREFKEKEIEACKDLIFAVCQDQIRAGQLSSENCITPEKIIFVPVCWRQTGIGKKDYFLYDTLNIDRRKKIALYMGSIDKWTMAEFIIDNFRAWPEDWVLVIHNRYGLDEKTLFYYEKNKQFSNIYFSDKPVSNQDKLRRIISSADIGIALYKSQYDGIWTGKNIKYIGMSSGKIASFLQNGVPVIVNEIGIMADYVKKYKLGLVISDCIKANFSENDLLLWKKNCLKFSKEKLDLNHYMQPVLTNIAMQLNLKTSEQIIRPSLKSVEVSTNKNKLKKSSEKYLVTAIVSTYNSEKYLRGCLEDLKAQTISDQLEIVVVDSGSEQNESTIVNEFQKDSSNIKYIRTEKRETVYQAWNRGVRAASGRYLTNANTDDRHRPDAFEIMVQVLNKNPTVGAVYADTLITDAENETFEDNTATQYFSRPNFTLRQILLFNFFGPQPMWRRSVHRKIGYFDEHFAVAADYDFFIRLSHEFGALHIGEILGLYTRRNRSIENSNREKCVYETFQVLKRYRNIVPIEEIYPDLKSEKEPEKAFAACLADQGNCCMFSGLPDIKGALTYYNRSCQYGYSEPELAANLGVALLLTGNQTEGVELLRRSADKVEAAAQNLVIVERCVEKGELPRADRFKAAEIFHPVVSAATRGKGVVIEKNDFKPIETLEKRWSGSDMISSLTGKTTGVFTHQSRPALVSVIVPTFNRPHMLKESLDSILSQTHQDFEIIVVNDGGTDVFGLIQNFRDPRIKYYQQKRKTGPAAARNTGIKNATGRFIALLDDDDIFYPEHLETAVKYLNNPYPVVYTDAVRASYAKRGETYELFRKSVPYSMEFDRNKLLIGNISPINCFVFDKQLAFQAGLFNESLGALEDWDFWIRLSALSPFKHIAQATVQVNWRKDGTTITSSLGPEFKKNREKIYIKYQDEIRNISNVNEIFEEFNQIWRNDWKEMPQLTSIVILTFNQIDYTQKCIESVLKHTKEHFELIIVDNGSSDGTVEYLQSEFKDLRPEIQTKIIQNTRNLGFAAGNNQGIAAAKGDYVLLLNNDVVVTRGWLQRLLSCAEQEPQTGIVGPQTNCVAGPQRVADVSYDLTSLAGLEQFAKQFGQKNNGQTSAQWRIVGFCMLIKRKVIEKIGGLDTIYGLGNFEDDDFCIRAKLAGFKAQIAQDCFVHHFGGKTFNGARIDYQESLNKNWEIFKRKWNIPAHTPPGPTYRVILPKQGFDPNTHYCPLLSNYHFKEPEDEKRRTFIEKKDSADHRFSDLNFNIPANPKDSKNMNPGGIGMENYEKMYQSIQPLLSSSNTEDAIAAVRNMVDLFPAFAQAHNDLGVLLYKQGEKEQALGHYEKAVQLDGANLTFKKNLADFYYVEQGRIEEALKLYVDVLAINPEDVETLLITGHICVGLQRLDDAEVFYNRVLEIEPWNADAQQLLEKIKNPGPVQTAAKTAQEMYQEVQALMAGNDPQAVINALKDLLATYPDFALAHNDLGVLYYNAGDKQSAFSHYERAAQLDPGNITFKKNLADFYFVEQNRVEDALKLYVEVLAIEPEDVETLLITGHICVSLQKFDDAKVFYNRVLEIEPWNTDARDNLATLESKREAI
jgi:GT2 family glycosyltransferase/Flp pilus assembly protein TadD